MSEARPRYLCTFAAGNILDMRKNEPQSKSLEKQSAIISKIYGNKQSKQ
jgi:hypothetical protein